MDRRVKIYALSAAALALAIDQATKAWVLSNLRTAGASLVLPGPVDLTLSFNLSNAFSLTPVVGDATRWLLVALNLTVAAFILHAILARTLKPLTRFGLALILAGAVGNALDRVLIGAVIDFLDATKIGFPWIFNVADATIDVGIVLLVLSAVWADRSGQTVPAAR